MTGVPNTVGRNREIRIEIKLVEVDARKERDLFQS